MITGQNYLNWSCVRCRQSDSQEPGSDRDDKTQHNPIFFLKKKKKKRAFTLGVLLPSPCIPALRHNHREEKGWQWRSRKLHKLKWQKIKTKQKLSHCLRNAVQIPDQVKLKYTRKERNQVLQKRQEAQFWLKAKSNFIKSDSQIK